MNSGSVQSELKIVQLKFSYHFLSIILTIFSKSEGGRGSEGVRDSHFSGFYRRVLGQIGILGGNWHSKTIFIKNSGFKPQKMIAIVDSTISYFCSPNLITFWQSVFASLLSKVYTPHPTPPLPLPPQTKIFFFGGGAKSFFVSCSQGLGKISNFLGTFCFGGT